MTAFLDQVFTASMHIYLASTHTSDGAYFAADGKAKIKCKHVLTCKTDVVVNSELLE